MKAAAFDLLQQLVQAHGTSGFEGDVRRIFEESLAGIRMERDALGNRIAVMHEKEGAPRVMVTGHFDEVGFVVRHITKEGHLKFVANGGWWGHTLLAQRVRVQTRHRGEVLGVISSTPPHFLDETMRKQVMSLDQMSIDIGATDRAEAEAFGVMIGDPVVPESPLQRMANPDLLMAKAFDNRVGIGVTIQALQQLRDLPTACTLYGVGTVQEEVGTRGAITAAARIKPDVAIVLEGTPADDAPGCDLDQCQGKIGGGPQIRLMDPTAHMNRALADLAIATARSRGIPHQIAVRSSGGTDARSIQLADQGTPVIVIGVPARYIHTHNTLIHLDDYLATLTLTVELIKELDAATIETLAP